MPETAQNNSKQSNLVQENNRLASSHTDIDVDAHRARTICAPTIPSADRSSDKQADSTELGRHAGLLSIGNVVGRVLGLIREMVISAYFGATGEVSAFRVASQVPTLIYDLLTGGMLSAALVPTLSEYSAPTQRVAFAKLAGSLISLFAFVLAIIVLLLELFVPQIAGLMAPGLGQEDPSLLLLTERLLRLILPSVWLISMAGVVMGILYAQKRFAFPAMSAAVFNLGIVIATPIFATQLGPSSLVVGILLGSAAQFGIMVWDLRRFLRQFDLVLPLQIIWKHPALRKMVRLYLPIAGVTLVSTGQVVLDRRLASFTDERSIAWMANATTLQQLPLGLISVAIALASLPRLSQHFAEGNGHAYKETLGRGLRLVVLLIAPAAVGLWFLGEPVIRLIFERGKFLPEDTVQVMSALQIYVLGMLFAAIDFPLNYAFYARNNTLLPSLVGLVSIFIYVVVAYALVNELGYLGLVWSDTIKHGSHMLIMGIALWWTVGRLHTKTVRCIGKTVAAAAAMAAFVWGGQQLRQSNLTEIVQLTIFGGGGLLIYLGMLYTLNVTEVRQATARLLPSM